MPEVVVMVGLPACGKSTWVKQHLAATHVVVSKDFWPHACHMDLRRRRAIVSALAEGFDVVVDDTNPSPADRAPVIEIARQHGATVRAVYIDTPPAECLTRHVARSGRSAVPTPGLNGLSPTGRRLVPPTVAEGFDRVETVSPVPA